VFLPLKIPWLVLCDILCLVYKQTNSSSQERLRIQPGSFVLSLGNHKASVTQLDLQHLGWEQDLPFHSLLPVKFIFPEFPCSQVPGSVPACCEEHLVALLELKCSK